MATFDELRATGRIPKALLNRYDAANNRAPPTQQEAEEYDDEPVLDTRDEELAQLREQNARLQGRLEATQQRAVEPAPKRKATVTVLDEPDEDLTADERERFSESESTITKLARREAKKLLRDMAPNLNQRLDDLDDKFNTVGESVVASRSATFKERVETELPQLSGLRKDPKFNTYLNAEPAEGLAGVTRRQIANHAWNSQDFATLSKLVKGFLGTSTKLDPSDFSRPSSPQRAQVRQVPSNGKAALKTSEWQHVTKQRMAGRISIEEFNQKDKAFKAAQRDGTLIDDINYATPRKNTAGDAAT